MSAGLKTFGKKSRLGVLLEHFATIDDPRDVRRILHPLAEVLLLVVCATIADCDDYNAISAWGRMLREWRARRALADHSDEPDQPGGVSGGITGWARRRPAGPPEYVAIDGKTSRRRHDRAMGAAPPRLVSAFATTSRLVPGQEAVSDKARIDQP
jgi:hypothetical protein